MKADCYDLERQPDTIGGGWRLRIFETDPETGESAELWAGVFSVAPGQEPEDAYKEALITGQTWMAVDAAMELAPGPDVRAVCPLCFIRLTHEVLRSAAGFYIGTRCECGPYSRESLYYETARAAAEDLASGSYVRAGGIR